MTAIAATETVGVPRPELVLPDGRAAIEAWALDAGILHLNHGSYGAVPRAALAEQQRLRDEMEADPVGWFIRLPGRMATARARLAPLLGIPADRFALVTNASAGASAVFGSLEHAPGGEIVVTDHGYGAVTMGAERLARRWGGTVRTAGIPIAADADEALAAVEAELGPRTRLVVVDQITSPTARRLPVEAIARAAAQIGAEVLVDGAHAPGMLAVPVPEIDASWVGNLHKFACAPRGSAVLVAAPSLRERISPVIDSWGSGSPFPERFDAQGTLDATGQLAAPASVDVVADTWGWEAVRAHATAVARYGAALLGDVFSDATGEDHSVDVGMPVGPIRLIRLPGPLADTPAAAHRLRDRLKHEHGAATAPTSFGGVGYLRIATHAYSTTAHYDEFADRLAPLLVAWARDGGV